MDAVFKTAPCSSLATTSMLLKFQWHRMRVWKLGVKSLWNMVWSNVFFFHFQDRERRADALYTNFLSWIKLFFFFFFFINTLDRFLKWINSSAKIVIGARHARPSADLGRRCVTRYEEFMTSSEEQSEVHRDSHWSTSSLQAESDSICTEISFLKTRGERKEKLAEFT